MTLDMSVNTIKSGLPIFLKVKIETTHDCMHKMTMKVAMKKLKSVSLSE